MSDYSSTKSPVSGNYPLLATEGGAAGFTRVAPMLTPERLKDEFLFGIPLKSPLTNQTMSDDTLKSIIAKSAAAVELKCKIDISPVQRSIKIMYDRTKFTQGWNQIDVGRANILSVEEWSIRSSNSTSTVQNVQVGNGEGSMLFKLPLEWIDLSMAHKGLLHLAPVQTTYTGASLVGGSPASSPYAPLFIALSSLNVIPGYWFVKFTCGFKDGGIPETINELIGIEAAIRVLSMIAPTNKYNSKSIGIDGASQGLGSAGPQWMAARLQDLKEQKAQLESLISAYYSNKIMMSNI